MGHWCCLWSLIHSSSSFNPITLIPFLYVLFNILKHWLETLITWQWLFFKSLKRKDFNMVFSSFLLWNSVLDLELTMVHIQRNVHQDYTCSRMIFSGHTVSPWWIFFFLSAAFKNPTPRYLGKQQYTMMVRTEQCWHWHRKHVSVLTIL